MLEQHSLEVVVGDRLKFKKPGFYLSAKTQATSKIQETGFLEEIIFAL